MSAKVTVTDPNNLVEFVGVIEDTDKVVVIHIDLRGKLKGEEISMISGNTVFFDDMETSITIEKFKQPYFFSNTNRYTCVITCVSDDGFDEEQIVFRGKK